MASEWNWYREGWHCVVERGEALGLLLIASCVQKGFQRCCAVIFSLIFRCFQYHGFGNELNYVIVVSDL